MIREPKLTLVGAGPGDPELLTLKAVRILADADVVLYDALINPEILGHINKGAERIFAGKRCGNHYMTQDRINETIVQKALEGKHVVRLKCGDPFVFGRGHEELEAANERGIPTEVVLGVSSVSLPGLYGVPLTRRGVNESYWVVTAVTKNGEVSNDLRLAAQSSATVVILMGLKRITEIMDIFVTQGKAMTPAAVIGKGSHPDGEIVSGNVATLAEKVKNSEIPAPAMIVVGEVARNASEVPLDGLYDDYLIESKSTAYG
ncbi:hypothetical protein FUAX_13660 [Fulvitalea axinellae]|uniref:uroporphyrinogen-III C-methyltransferase n=1 Tax=Fulvitalea axinellae TaxID=1182444 RepID=A0AAU9CR67_9BACT|nr:hypothetical protein FUAX_13660 [Fulvitalea axinellae]